MTDAGNCVDFIEVAGFNDFLGIVGVAGGTALMEGFDVVGSVFCISGTSM